MSIEVLLNTKMPEKEAREEIVKNPPLTKDGPLGDHVYTVVSARAFETQNMGFGFFFTLVAHDDGKVYDRVWLPDNAEAKKKQDGTIFSSVKQVKAEMYQEIRYLLAAMTGFPESQADKVPGEAIKKILAGDLSDARPIRFKIVVNKNGWKSGYSHALQEERLETERAVGKARAAEYAARKPAAPSTPELPGLPALPGVPPVLVAPKTPEEILTARGLLQHPADPTFWYSKDGTVKKVDEWLAQP